MLLSHKTHEISAKERLAQFDLVLFFPTASMPEIAQRFYFQLLSGLSWANHQILRNSQFVILGGFVTGLG